MNWHVSRRDLRRTVCRDKKANRQNAALSPEMTCQFKADQCSQAVSEEGKRPIEKWIDGLRDRLNKRRKVSERLLPQPGSATWELNRTYLDILWQAV